nr:Splicing factor 45 [Euglena gracilis]
MADSALYSDLPAAKDEEGEPKAEARWVGPATLMPTAARKRDADGPAAPSAAKKRARPAPLVAYDGGDGPDAADAEAGGDGAGSPAGDDSKPTALPFSAPVGTPATAKPAPASVEYNPLQPNDYEDVLKERRVKAAQRKKEEEMERRRREMQKFDEREGLTPLELTGDDAWKRRAILSGRSPDELPDAEPDPDATEEKKLTPAERMMMAMGWKGEGSGLGKNQDGISTPLMHRKTSQSAGQIVQAPPKQAPPKKAAPAPAAPAKKPTKRLRGRPSEVIMLRNMVVPGEVDADLCSETEE